MRIRNRMLVVATVPSLLVALSGCGNDAESSKSQTNASVIEVVIDKQGCNPQNLTATEGKTKFNVSNKDAPGIDEFYIYEGNKVFAEVEQVTVGVPKSMTVDLKPGSYTTKCPGGTERESGTLQVSAKQQQGTN